MELLPTCQFTKEIYIICIYIVCMYVYVVYICCFVDSWIPDSIIPLSHPYKDMATPSPWAKTLGVIMKQKEEYESKCFFVFLFFFVLVLCRWFRHRVFGSDQPGCPMCAEENVRE